MFRHGAFAGRYVIASGQHLLGDEQALTWPGVPSDDDMAEAPLRDAMGQADDPDPTGHVAVSSVGTATAVLLRAVPHHVAIGNGSKSLL